MRRNIPPAATAAANRTDPLKGRVVGGSTKIQLMSLLGLVSTARFWNSGYWALGTERYPPHMATAILEIDAKGTMIDGSVQHFETEEYVVHEIAFDV